MVAERLMLDSGAFTVWTKELHVDLDAYIDFCVDHPEISYYVNLDVIPGKPNDRQSLHVKQVEKACKEGWKNYKRMLKRLPKERVIPVYHQGDDKKWLERMLDFGCPYIGISPANDRTSRQRLMWMKDDVNPLVLDSQGKAVVKTHGFAVTSIELIKSFPWHSVDSASWVIMGGLGQIYVPRQRGGEFDYTKEPDKCPISDRSPAHKKFRHHYSNRHPEAKKQIDEYLKFWEMNLGSYDLPIECDSAHKLQSDERWLDKSKTSVIKIKSKGVMTCDQERKWLNMKFFQQANIALEAVEYIYLAGMGVGEKIEKKMINRLLSYYEITKSKEARKALAFHLQLQEDE